MIDLLGVIGGAIVAVVVAWLAGRRKGAVDTRSKMEAQANADEKKRVEKGRDAVRSGRDDDPSERLRRNDGSW